MKKGTKQPFHGEKWLPEEHEEFTSLESALLNELYCYKDILRETDDTDSAERDFYYGSMWNYD